MKGYVERLAVVGVIFVFSIGVGVLVTQEDAPMPFHPEDIADARGIYDFTWSPDGRFIAYVTSAGGNSDIWVAPSAGGAPRRLTSTPFQKKQPRWSGDGRWIAYVAVQQGGNGNIHIVSEDGQTAAALTDPSTDDANPTWSPDSQYLAFTEKAGGRSGVARVDLRTSTIQRLADLPASDLQWSPDGDSILLVADPLQPRDDGRENEDIFILSADGGTARLLTPGTHRFRDNSPSWAPDSKQIAYISDQTGYNHVYVLDTQTLSQRAITSGNVDHIQPQWSPDGRRIAYLRIENMSVHLYATNLDDGSTVRISDRDGANGGFETDDAAPRSAFAWSPDGGRIAFTYSDPGRASDILIGALDGIRPMQLTDTMPAALQREARFVWPEAMTYRSFDGREIGALVYKPRGPRPGSGYPALLIFRDSLDGAHTASWNPFIQFFVSHGYLVFAPNVRGSGGRGKEFRQLVHGAGGDHDVRDAFFGLDRLSSEGLIDPQRVGVMGAGTGGFLAAAALVRDESRFKAAVSLYGVMDAVTASSYPSMAAWTRYMIGSTPMENPLPYYERSLVNFVDKLRTPIIFLYAGQDPSAPLQQLQQFAVQAEVKGKWYDYRVFENEIADWREWRPSVMRLALEAMDALFDRYLMGEERDIRLTRNR